MCGQSEYTLRTTGGDLKDDVSEYRCVAMALFLSSVSKSLIRRRALRHPRRLRSRAVADSFRRIAAGGYAGAEACRSCHKPEFQEFSKTAHATPPQQKDSVAGCEMCNTARVRRMRMQNKLRMATMRKTALRPAS